MLLLGKSARGSGVEKGHAQKINIMAVLKLKKKKKKSAHYSSVLREQEYRDASEHAARTHTRSYVRPLYLVNAAVVHARDAVDPNQPIPALRRLPVDARLRGAVALLRRMCDASPAGTTRRRSAERGSGRGGGGLVKATMLSPAKDGFRSWG